MIRTCLTSRAVGFAVRTAISALLILAFLVPAVFAGDWQGQVVEKEGVKHVMNPAAPMEDGLVVNLQENWRLGMDDESDEEFFGVIARVLVDGDGRVFVLDAQLNEIKIYDADGMYETTIGREGEGPGEFRGASDMFFTSDGRIAVMQTLPGRIVTLSKDGEPGEDIPLPQDETGASPFLLGGRRLGDDILMAGWMQKIDAGKYEMNRYMATMDYSGNEKARVHESLRHLDFANVVFDENEWDTFDSRWAVSPDDARIYACVDHFPYAVSVWNSAGEPSMIIEREYKRLPRSEEKRERVESIYKAFTRQVPNSNYKIYPDDKDVQSIYPREDGSLWVLTSRGVEEKPDGAIGIFDVYNRSGQFVRQVTLHGDGNPTRDNFMFVGDRLFVLTGWLDAAMAAQGGGPSEEEEELEEAEPMGVICYQIDVPNMGL